MALVKPSEFSSSVDVVVGAPSFAGSMKRNDYNLRTNGKYWLPLSLSSARFGLRLRVRAVLSSSSWSPPASQRDINDSDISAPSKFWSPIEAGQRDAISLLKERIRSGHCKRESPSSRPICCAFERFGVKQKEKIASFKTSVDVFTLSATPIPRTLYLSLTGFCDARIISTPPPERVPIRTHLSAYTKKKVISAIKHELDRGGQVFYVLPRIKGNINIGVSLCYVY